MSETNQREMARAALQAAKTVIEMMERPADLGDEVRAALDRRVAKIDQALAILSQAVADIVPEGRTGKALVFDHGALHVNKDGSGYFVVDEDEWTLEDDRCEGPDGPEGSVHWITRLDASEMQALRDFLNDDIPTAQRAADVPGYWMHETSGVLRPAVKAYLHGDALTYEQIAVMRAYLRQWINAPAWVGRQIAYLRNAIDDLSSRAAIGDWLEVAMEEGIYPL